jgi:nitroreductase
MTTQRQPDYPIHEMFLNRWSPKAFTAQPITQEELLTMLEAARWAASSYNSQPWRFLYALRDTCARVVCARISYIALDHGSPRSGHEVPSPTHSFDAGTASGYFALQDSLMGWYVHGMAGFDADTSFEELSVPKGYALQKAVAIAFELSTGLCKE